MAGRVLSVVVPCFNEAPTLRPVLDRVAAQPEVGEIVLVDDGSRDGSRRILGEIHRGWPAGAPPLRIFLLPENRGKGAAVRAGLRHVRFPLTVVQDADLEYDPSDYARLVQPILDGEADVVYGSRFLGAARRVPYFWQSFGNRVLTFLSNLATDLALSDMMTCYKVFRSELLPGLRLRSVRFGFEPEVTAEVARLGLRVWEVAVSYRGRRYEEGKKIRWTDAVQAIAVILGRWRRPVSRRRRAHAVPVPARIIGI